MSAQPIFDDEIVTATDLNSHPGEILDRALKKPLTIVRNDEAFALLVRTTAARLVSDSMHAGRMVDFTLAVCERYMSGALGRGHPYEWINEFAPGDTRQMLDELTDAFNNAHDGRQSWDEFEAVLHEWQETAAAIRSRVCTLSLHAPDDEVPLSGPPWSGL